MHAAEPGGSSHDFWMHAAEPGGSSHDFWMHAAEPGGSSHDFWMHAAEPGGSSHEDHDDYLTSAMEPHHDREIGVTEGVGGGYGRIQTGSWSS